MIFKYFIGLFFLSTAVLSQSSSKKSLLIIFDGTSSMSTDLAQLKAAAISITEYFTSLSYNPIDNYVLVVFRDPDVQPAYSTSNPTDFLNQLNAITISGGDDCPELAIEGLRRGLEQALPSSIAFVLSDASAKDFDKENEVQKIIQEKQVKVFFLSTGNCDAKSSQGFKVFESIASKSNGQVYDMKRNDVSAVLNELKDNFNPKRFEIITNNFEDGENGTTSVDVDKSVSEICATAAGSKATLDVYDPEAKKVALTYKMSMDDLRKGCVKDPVSGKWTFVSTADSKHSVKVDGDSELKFEYGFSISPTTNHSATQLSPIANQRNIITIFVSNPSFLKELREVEINSNLGILKIPLKKIEDGIYETERFEVPKALFKIFLEGEDSEGNEIRRMLSSSLGVAASGSPPIVTNVEATKTNLCEGEDVMLKCNVKVTSSSKISWVKNGDVLLYSVAETDKEYSLSLTSVTSDDAGQYKCSASNDEGNSHKLIALNVSKSPSSVTISTNYWRIVEGVQYSYKCNSTEGESVKWIDHNGNVLLEGSSTYEFVADIKNNGKKLTCEAKISDCIVRDSKVLNIKPNPRAAFSTRRPCRGECCYRVCTVEEERRMG